MVPAPSTPHAVATGARPRSGRRPPRPPHTVLRRLAVLAALALFASACWRYDVTTVVQEDGSGQLTIAILFGPEIQAFEGEDGSDNSGFDASMPEGAVLTDVEDGDYTGRQAVISFASLDELNDLVIGPLVFREDRPSETAAFTSFEVTRDGSLIVFDARSAEFENESNVDDLEITSQLVVSLELPGVVVASNADEVTDPTLIWRIDNGTARHLTARSQTEIVGGFVDVAGNVHAPAIVWVAEQGITTGYPDDTFRPTLPVTRGQMATFLTRALDLPPGTASFSDVAGSVHAAGIAAVAAAGITTGFPDNTFRPGDPVTRGQMAAFLTRALDLPPGTASFPDAIGTTHEASIAAVAAAGITTGFPDNTFRPGDAVTRGQMATFLQRALDPDLAG